MNLYKKIVYAGAITGVLITGSCKKLLQENPKSQIVPSFFSTPSGILGGIAGVYNDMRGLWGTEGFSATTLAGTDEVMMGGSASGQNFYTYNGLSGSDENGGLWNIAYQDINTLNGVLQYGTTAALDSVTKQQYLGQAKFLRGLYYFYLVQTFGDVPLHLSFVTTASTADSRQPIATVYTQIIRDLTDASTQLPATVTAPFLGKAATQAAALYLLAKVYLTRGWSTATVAGDFAQAASIASTLITNKANYGIDLWQDYASVFAKVNDYGKENLFVSDHDNDTKYGEYVLGASGGAGANVAPWLFRWNYVTLGVNSSGNPLVSSGSAMMTRDVANGRPYTRTRPNNNYVWTQAFGERVNDSRYDNTFQTVWVANTAGVTGTRGTLKVGVDTAIWMPGYEATAAQSAAFKGVIVSPSQYTNTIFPTVKKFDDLTRTGVNDPSTRPVVLFRFADAYLIAAEAYFKAGDNVNAAKYINVIRERAAYRSANSAAQNATAAAAMDITPAQVTLDFILDERTREFFDEFQRWWDLVRTQSLVARVNAWNPEAAAHIQSYHVLRPIPQSQIDLVTSGPAFPQNKGY